MGDSTRMNRTARFMEEFGEAICQASWIKEGDVFKVTDIFLTNERGNVELVATIAGYNLVSRFLEALQIHSHDAR